MTQRDRKIEGERERETERENEREREREREREQEKFMPGLREGGVVFTFRY